MYLEETIKSLNELQIMGLFLKNSEHATNTMMSFADEMKELNSSLKRLESDVIQYLKIEHALVQLVACLERQCWKNAQYSCWECVKIMDTHPSIDHSPLEQRTCNILQYISVKIRRGRN